LVQQAQAYNDEATWTALREGGFRNIQQHFSVERATEAMLDVLREALVSESSAAETIERNRRAIAMEQC
jgi:hypothetical protein